MVHLLITVIVHAITPVIVLAHPFTSFMYNAIYIHTPTDTSSQEDREYSHKSVSRAAATQHGPAYLHYYI